MELLLLLFGSDVHGDSLASHTWNDPFPSFVMLTLIATFCSCTPSFLMSSFMIFLLHPKNVQFTESLKSASFTSRKFPVCHTSLTHSTVMSVTNGLKTMFLGPADCITVSLLRVLLHGKSETACTLVLCDCCDDLRKSLPSQMGWFRFFWYYQ